jgi:alkanesulfonate monooxygenase SsuD/methylene tetrahydromethanopterin reductase-like flavin-dependent oxidoreductase (luciferase family)
VSDYGHPLEFGYFLVPDAADPTGVLETARLADELGYDLVGVQDHPYQPRHLDTMSLLAAILAKTQLVRVFAAVADLPLRPPPVLAKTAATLDLLSDGRFVLGIGAGGFLDAAHAMGAPAWTPGQSLAALEEAIPLIRGMWAAGGRGLRFAGDHYQLEGVHAGPAPARPIPIWVGANKPRALALTGRLADGWVVPLMNYKPPQAVARDSVALDQAARTAGRDPDAIRRIYIVGGAFTHGAEPATDADQAIVGPPEHWVEVLTHLAVDLGIGSFLLMGEPEPGLLTTFIREVAPAVHERVSQQRAAERTHA